MSSFVVRDTNHPAEDIARNWSAPAGGSSIGLDAFDTAEEAQEAYEAETGDRLPLSKFRYHEAYEGFVEVHYEGLGAFVIEAETLEEAIVEAASYEDGLAVCSEAGDGHFFAYDVVSYHEVRPGRWVFELK